MEYTTNRINTFELAAEGMDCLTTHFGIIGAEEFIAMVLREKLDYTKWRKTYYDAFTPDEFHCLHRLKREGRPPEKGNEAAEGGKANHYKWEWLDEFV